MTPSLRLCATTAPSLQQTIDHLIDCFARHDTEGYFACFHPEARFVFIQERAAFAAELVDI